MTKHGRGMLRRCSQRRRRTCGRRATIRSRRPPRRRSVARARQRLVLWDLPEEAIRRLDETRQADSTVVFRAPVDGFVIEKQALKGQHVMPGQTLYKVADLTTVWVEADVYETELSALRV